MKNAFVFFLIFTFLPNFAFAFCGFYVGGSDQALYNDATNVILMRDGTSTILSMQNDYSGPLEDFAMVIPVPQVLKKENVKTLAPEIFAKVDKLAAPRLVEYWEQDPCAVPRSKFYDFDDAVVEGELLSADSGRVRTRPKVKIEAKFNVAEYEILMLSTEDSTALEDWLIQNKYKIPKNAAQYFQPYVETGMYFFVAKVNIKKVKRTAGGKTILSPIRFNYDSGDFNLPIRLGLINSRGTQDLIVHILADDQRYEAGNYPSVTIPTNFELKESARERFGQFYASVFDAVLEAKPGAVVTEYAWQVGMGKCDPCPPGAAGLTTQELLTLGGDVILADAQDDIPRSGLRKKKQAKNRIRQQKQLSPNFVLTRLHTRYKAGKVGQDLVFKKVKPIVGGRQNDGDYGAFSSTLNQFQGRYIIRHAWKGETECKEPRYGVWGSPPAQKMQVATQTAYIEKRDLDYSAIAKADVKLINRIQKK